ncbi:PH domain-containing protein [Kineosporia babensis]|uniref:PH domain-containing protein n=1 Tax=Kineosporia babensis TaxID=499548 RepID=A0A9X1SWK2_9ACTN|nr:PH domain-containing protein [Kineosporia babensis]MCD5315177.1 PH domain-containing protein [Kineosporia babensis]
MRHSERYGPGVPAELDRYLIPSENIVFMFRRHWIILFEPAASAIFGLVMLAWLTSLTSGLFVTIAAGAWLILLARLGLHLWWWWDELIIATNRRLMRVHGIITRQVDIMPMSKVTDMRYDRTVPGQILGYGRFVVESAGQDQALSSINYIPDSDLHYQQISQIIFAPSDAKITQKTKAPGTRVPITEPDQAGFRAGK